MNTLTRALRFTAVLISGGVKFWFGIIEHYLLAQHIDANSTKYHLVQCLSVRVIRSKYD